MKLTPDVEARERIADRAFYQDYLRRLFHQRRKLLRSLLVGMYRKQLGKPQIDALLAERGIGETARAEELPPDAHVSLANLLHSAVHKPAGDAL